MVQQFVSFMVDAGYDGPDVTGEGDYGEVDPVKKASDTDCLLKAAMVAGFQPNICLLYRGQRSPCLERHGSECIESGIGTWTAMRRCPHSGGRRMRTTR